MHDTTDFMVVTESEHGTHLHADEVAHVVNGLTSALMRCLKAFCQPVQGLLPQVYVHPLCVFVPPEAPPKSQVMSQSSDYK